ncbi:hypothetical protein CPB86DRAFT_778149 [Serendipita vermifera]|nr:hypothetical protein CPB86DRAFT_778149 [Serendipita vermifera]
MNPIRFVTVLLAAALVAIAAPVPVPNANPDAAANPDIPPPTKIKGDSTEASPDRAGAGPCWPSCHDY